MATRNSLVSPIGLAFLLALSRPAGGQPPSPATPLDLLKAKGVNAEITVFPVRLGPRALPPAGEVLAILLEHGGMRNIDWITEVFPRTGDATFEQMTVEFGDHVRRSAITTPYALYLEVLFEPAVGPAEIRGVIAGKDGKPVWIYRRTRQDAEFQKTPPPDPLECIAMAVNALRPTLGLDDPFRKDPYEGKLSQRNAERTGLPSNSERSAMQAELAEARANFAGSRIVIFPVLMQGQPNPKQAVHLAEALNGEKFGKADVTMAQPAVKIPSGPNEQERLWKVARAVRDHLRQTPVEADYTIYADYAFAPDGRPFTVHFIVSRGNGEWVIVDFQNDHWPDFKSMELNSADDCDRLVIKRLDRILRKAPRDGK